MFNLIITIISIALVAVLAIATIYYGGAAFTQGSAKAAASTLVSHAQQIAAAETLYANEHGGAITTTLTDLTTGNYLTSIPVSANVDATGYVVSAAGEVSATLAANTDPICVAVNASLGSTSTTVPSAKPTTQYGCWLDSTLATPANVFYFKG